MISKEMKLLIGENLYNGKTAQELYELSEYYKQKFVKTYEDIESGQLFLYYAYAAFMEGCITDDLCTNIAVMIERGFLLPGHNKNESYDISLAILQRGVEQLQSGHCAYRIYLRFNDGKNNTLSFSWLQKAALYGFSEAQFHLGNKYKTEFHSPYDAEEWWLAAAQQGHVTAMYNLGILYGNGFFLNDEKAGYWLEQAAQRGSNNAKNTLQKNFFYNEKKTEMVQTIIRQVSYVNL